MLTHTYVGPSPLLSGRTIFNYGKQVIAESKKILSLMDEAVKAKIINKVDKDEYEYSSGKKILDIYDFILFRMYHWSTFNGATMDNCIDCKCTNTSGDVTAVQVQLKSDNAKSRAVQVQQKSNNAKSGDDIIEFVSVKNKKDIQPVGEDLAVSDVFDEDSDAELENPPSIYLPTGFIYFMTRGPLAEKAFRVDIKGLNDNLDGKSRNESRKDQRKMKASQRDYDLGMGDEGRQQRGLALGSDSLREVAIVAQQQEKPSNAKLEAEIIKRDILLRSLNNQLTSTMGMAKMYHKIGNSEGANLSMTAANDLMKQMSSTRAEVND